MPTQQVAHKAHTNEHEYVYIEQVPMNMNTFIHIEQVRNPRKLRGRSVRYNQPF